MDIAAEIRGIAASALTDPSLFIVDVIVSAKLPRKVMVLLDGDEGVGIDACADLSRAIGNVLEEAAWMEENYTLDVSTPGVDHPLKLTRQYPKHVGRRMRIKIGERIEEGKLVMLTDEKISLEQETGSAKKKEVKTIEIPFTDIEKAFVLVSFK